jgi:hypothetical protein
VPCCGICLPTTISGSSKPVRNHKPSAVSYNLLWSLARTQKKFGFHPLSRYKKALLREAPCRVSLKCARYSSRSYRCQISFRSGLRP